MSSLDIVKYLNRIVGVDEKHGMVTGMNVCLDFHGVARYENSIVIDYIHPLDDFTVILAIEKLIKSLGVCTESIAIPTQKGRRFYNQWNWIEENFDKLIAAAISNVS